MTMPLDDDGEFTELFDANLPRADMVGAPAHGWPGWLVMKQDAEGALLDPDFVRGLISKAAPQDTTEGPVPDSATRDREQVTTPNGLTLTGSPADIASFIHKAAVAARDRGQPGGFEVGTAFVQAAPGGDVAKAEMPAKDVNDLPDSDFAYIEPGGEKDDSGKTVPRSKRHFPIHDKAHADNAAARIAQGAKFGDKAKPKVDAAQRKFGEKNVSKEEAPVAPVAKDLMDAAGDSVDLDDGMDGLDPTVPLATPADQGVPGDPTDPGSPAWEAIDAATAQKWTGILARAQYAVGLLAEREMLEAASADPDDAGNACDLSTVCDALDYAIGVLAPFAVGEQSEADCGAMEMAAIGKAAGMLRPGDLRVIEGFAAVKKAGRVLSSGNEQAIRSAVASLQQVLDSLPQAPVAKSKTKEAAMPATPTAGEAPAAPVAKEGTLATPEEQARSTTPVSAGGTTGMGQPRATGPDSALPADGPQAPLPGDVPGRTVIKSSDGDGADTLTAVFDAQGDLVGVVPASAIQPVAGAGAAAQDDGGDAPADPAADAGDMTPQPSADAGTPADEVGKAAGQEDVITVTRDVLKGIAQDAARTALEAQGAAHQEAVAKMAAGMEGQAEELRVVKARLAQVEEQPATPGVFTNGQQPPAAARPVPPGTQLRGQDQGAPPVDVAKAAELKDTLYNGSGPAQARAFHELEGMAITKLHQIRSGQHSPAAG